MVFNNYQIPGGELVAFRNERNLLRERGHEVYEYTRSNDDIEEMSPLAAGLRTVWSGVDYRNMKRTIRNVRPDIIHVHNTFPLISPSAYFAAAAEKVPVVQTLHNYRIFCPRATFYRDGKVCEDCLGKRFPWPGVRHGCYRNDRKATLAVATKIGVHHALGTWKRYVTRYIALTEFTRLKYIEGGLPAERVVLKPNFLKEDPGYGRNPQRFALFIGRLSPEKGIETLLEAWRSIGEQCPLKIAGSGPLADKVREHARSSPGVEYLGLQDKKQIYSLLRTTSFLLFPSLWYECMPYTLLEAFAIGTPLIVSRLGSMETFVRHEVTGLHADAGSPASWAEHAVWALDHPEETEQMGQEGRKEFETVYAADASYEKLMRIYRSISRA